MNLSGDVTILKKIKATTAYVHGHINCKAQFTAPLVTIRNCVLCLFYIHIHIAMMILLLICFTGLLQLGNVSAMPTSERSVDSISKEYKLQFYVQVFQSFLPCLKEFVMIVYS